MRPTLATDDDCERAVTAGFGNAMRVVPISPSSESSIRPPKFREQFAKSASSYSAFLATAIVVAMILSACGGQVKDAKADISGNVVLSDFDSTSPNKIGEVCKVGGGLADAEKAYKGYNETFRGVNYDGIANGQIVVKNEAGSILGVGVISDSGIFQVNPTMGCAFTFKVMSVPSAKFYTFQIGSRPGSPAFPAAEVKSPGFKATMTL